MDQRILLFLLAISLIINISNLIINLSRKSNFKDLNNFTTQDVYKCFNKGLNCSWGRLGCECPSGPISGSKGCLKCVQNDDDLITQ